MKVCLLSYSLLEEKQPLKMVAPACLLLSDFALQDPEIASRWSIKIDRFSQAEGDEDIVLRYARSKPDLVGFSCYVWNMTRILALCRKVKLASPGTLVVLGGPEPADCRRALERAEVDFVVTGEGEEPFSQLLKALNRSAEGIERIPGVCSRDGQGAIRCQGIPRPPDLETSPLLYTEERTKALRLEAVYETARGCPFRCHFCNWGQIGHGVRPYPLSRVLHELGNLLANPEIKRIQFIDAWLDHDPNRLKEILRFVAKENVHGTGLAGYLSFRKADSELVSLVKRSNFAELGVGIQTIQPGTLKTIKRGWATASTSNGTFERVAAEIGRDRFIVELIYGLPGDDYRAFADSLRWCLARGFRRLRCFRALALPGSRFYDHPEEYGLVFDRDPLHLVYRSGTYTYEAIVRSEWLYETLQVILACLREEDLDALSGMGVDLVGIADEMVEHRLGEESARALGDHPTEMYSYLLEVDPGQSHWVRQFLGRRGSRPHRILADLMAVRCEGSGHDRVAPR